MELNTFIKKQKKAEWYLAKKRNPQKVLSPPFAAPSSSPEPWSPTSNLSALQTSASHHTTDTSSPSSSHHTTDTFSPSSSHHTSVTSSPSPNPSNAPATYLHSQCEGGVLPTCDSDDTVLLSSEDESKSDLPHPSRHLPSLRRQPRINVPNSANSISNDPSQPQCSSTACTSLVQHFQ